MKFIEIYEIIIVQYEPKELLQMGGNIQRSENQCCSLYIAVVKEQIDQHIRDNLYFLMG
jgi:hypothetical protein